MKQSDGTYNLAFDGYGYDGGRRHDGHKLLEKFGDGLKKLTQTYAVQVATMAAKAKGWMVSRQTLPSGMVKLTMTGV